MTWTLLILIVTGSVISSSGRLATIPMQTKSACIEAGRSMFTEAAARGAVSRACISSETGEVVQIK